MPSAACDTFSICLRTVLAYYLRVTYLLTARRARARTAPRSRARRPSTRRGSCGCSRACGRPRSSPAPRRPPGQGLGAPGSGLEARDSRFLGLRARPGAEAGDN
eukprot:scaffold46798_cov75-Phaeocystis_antarctica.AAC.1